MTMTRLAGFWQEKSLEYIVSSLTCMHKMHLNLNVCCCFLVQYLTISWCKGCVLVWDVTCPDIFSPSYTSKEVGAVANVVLVNQNKTKNIF